MFSEKCLHLKTIHVFFNEASGNENYHRIARLLLVGLADVMQDAVRSHFETVSSCKLGFNQNYYTFAFILPIKIFMCSEIC